MSLPACFIHPYLDRGKPTYANQCLKKIAYDYLGANYMHHLYEELQPNSINFTYGYLGLFSNLYFRNKLNYHNNLYIIDHPPVTGNLKGSIFRLHRADSTLTSQIIAHNYLSSEQLNTLLEYIKSLQDDSSISLTLPAGSYQSINSASGSKNIGLFIKPSSVLSELRGCSDKYYQNYLNSLKYNKAALCHTNPLISTKEWEMSFSNNGQILKKVYKVERHSFLFSQVKYVYCATSMLFIQFILKSIPVYLSNAHPCYQLCGSYVPALSKSEAIDFVEYLIARTTVSFKSPTKLIEQLSDQAVLDL